MDFFKYRFSNDTLKGYIVNKINHYEQENLESKQMFINLPKKINLSKQQQVYYL
jgi:hypothetical protein